MRCTNEQLEGMVKSLEPVLKTRSLVGYKAAVNMRRIAGAVEDYQDYRNDLIREFGEEVRDDDGKVIDFAVTPQSAGFGEFVKRLEGASRIEHEIEVLKASPDDVIGVLSGEEIFAIDWMMEHEEE